MQLFAKLRLSAFLVGLVATAAATEFTVAALKVMPALGDSAANYARFETLARQTAAGGAHLVVTPECCLDGYLGSPKFPPRHDPRDDARVPPRNHRRPSLRNVAALARELKLHILSGFSERRGTGLFNTMALFPPDGVIADQARSDHRDMLMFGRVVLDERILDRGSYRVRHSELYRPLTEPRPPKP